jgi:hypothetical protein
LLELGREIVASIVDAPEVEGTARAVASIADRDSPLAEASRRFWSIRLRLATDIVERAVSRGEVPSDTDASVLVETVVAPIYFRLLMTREGLEAGEDALASSINSVSSRSSMRSALPDVLIASSYIVTSFGQLTTK